MLPTSIALIKYFIEYFCYNGGLIVEPTLLGEASAEMCVTVLGGLTRQEAACRRGMGKEWRSPRNAAKP
jgi:hypothetical protein